jgi:hypothetical protein
MNSFALSVLMSKKAMPRPSDAMVKKAVSESVKIMTSEKSESCVTIDFERLYQKYACEFKLFEDESSGGAKIVIDRPFLEDELRRTMREYISEHKFTYDDLSKPNFPSFSSNFEKSVKQMGTIGVIDGLPDSSKVRFSDLDIKFELTRVEGFQSKKYGRKARFEEFGREQDQGKVVGFNIDLDKFEIEYGEWFSKIYDLAVQEEPAVKVVGLKEPLKIRTISKGPPLTYFVLKGLQKWMWKRLQSFWNFELTGTPITESLMNKRFGRPLPGARIHSGDYKSATDELHAWVSRCLLDEFLRVMGEDNFPPGFRQMCLNALTDHIYVQDGVRSPQKRGQLMGSILSFPFLCLANITLVRVSYELSHGLHPSQHGGYGVSLRKLPAWINGDDCATMYTDPTFPDVWEAVGGVMGFTKSIGKTYDAETMASINSRFFELDEAGKWRLIPFVNGGLLHGMKRSVAVDKDGQEEDPFELADKLHEMCACLDRFPDLKDRCIKRFKHLNSNRLKKYQGPWHLPIFLCGLGLSELKAPDDYELKRCRRLLQMYHEGTPVPRRMNNAEMKLHDLTNRLLNNGEQTVKDERWSKMLREDWKDWMGYTDESYYGPCYIALCFRVWSLRDGKGFYVRDPKGSSAMISKMARLWTKSASNCEQLKPVGIEATVVESKRSFTPLIPCVVN